MSLVHERNRRLFSKIQDEFLNSGDSIECCCNRNGITSRTYYNIKKRLENNDNKNKTSNKIFTSQKSTSQTPICKKPLTKHDITTPGVDIELVPSSSLTNGKKRKPSKQKSRKSSWDDLLREANEVLKM